MDGTISDKPGKCPICGMDLVPVFKTPANARPESTPEVAPSAPAIR